MFKRWFQEPDTEVEIDDASHRNGAVDRTPVTVERPPDPEPSREPNGVAKFATFDEIYRNATVKPPKVTYGILKLAEMVNSPHLGGMSLEGKRGSLLMALDAANVHLEDLLQDAMIRQRALNDYEEMQHKRLKDFEAVKMRENEALQAEIDRLHAAQAERIQNNLDEIARHEDTFRAWKKRKQQESETIAEAAAYCAPSGAANNTGSLAASLARYGAEAVVGKGS